jgi:hypothetical protein
VFHEGIQKRYIINLTVVERAALEALLRGKTALRKRQRALILLKADDGLSDAEIAEEVEVDHRTVERVRERCCLYGLEVAIEQRKPPRPPRESVLDGAAEARLVQIACSSPPDGRARWTLSLLANRMVELRIVDTVSKSTVGRRLKKRIEALARRALLHSRIKQWPLRTRHGGRLGRVPPTLRSPPAAGVRRRNQQAVAGSRAGSDPCVSGRARAS